MEYLRGALAALAAGSVVLVCIRAGDRSARLPAECRSVGIPATNIKDPRWLGVLERRGGSGEVAADAGRPARLSARREVVAGRGHRARHASASCGGAVAELEVDRQTGRVADHASLRRHRRRPGGESRQRRKPDQRAARADGEPDAATRRVTFDTRQVTSLDWSDYPILRFEDARRSRRSWCSGSTSVRRGGRGSDGGGRRGDRQCVLRCDGVRMERSVHAATGACGVAAVSLAGSGEMWRP